MAPADIGGFREVKVAAYYGGKRIRPRGGFHLYSWYFLRVSGIALVFLALGHLLVTHYIALPFETNFSFVAGRYLSPLWRTFDLLLLTVALIHGLALGFQLSIEDYVHGKTARLVSLAVLYGLVYLFIALGTVNILMFEPRQTPAPLAPGDPLWLGDLMGVLLFGLAFATYVGAIVLIVWLVQGWRSSSLYRGGWAMAAWALHRASGIGVGLFLLIHIFDITLINISPAVYDHTVSLYENPLLIPMEVALVGAVVYHALNGLRVISLDLWLGALRRQTELFYAVLTLTVVIAAPSLVLILLPR